MLSSLSPASARYSPGRLLRSAVLATFCLAAGGALLAFPPSPYYTIYGLVRDQVGSTLQADGAEIVLLRDAIEIGRAPITHALHVDWNYELRIRIDQNRASTRTYTASAVPALGLYSLAVDLNGQRYYPIEVSGNLTAGRGGERVQLDLNLGVDTDHDGLPDAWEEWQLYQAGHYPGGPGWDISLIKPDGDFDHDGISDLVEYLAGTFAGDATERFELKIVSLTGTTAAFEFFAITGKVYHIESSADLKTWTEIPFSVVPGATPAGFYRATDVGVLPAYATVTPGENRFYRLTVR